MPTAAERAGDFSQTVNSQGRLIHIRDPLKSGTCNVNSGGPACFTNNIIPADRINPIGRALLSLLPLPNATDPSGNRQYNYQYQNITEKPRNDQVVRVDWNVRPGTTFYSRLQFGHEVNNRSYSGFLGSSGNRGWPQFYTSYEVKTYSSVNTLIHSFGPTTIFERYSDDTILRLVEQPPLMDTRTTNYTTIPLLLSSNLVQSTRGVIGFDPGNFHAPTVYNWSLGVQRELPFKLTADIAYVGNAGRHNLGNIPVNSFTYGTLRTDLNPQNADPTNGGRPKDSDYLRPYRGYGAASIVSWRGYSDYDSIQISLQRRLTNGLAWGFAYTGSVRRSLTTFDPFLCPNSAPTCSSAENEAANRARNYNMAGNATTGSRPHNIVINYNYQVPGPSRFVRGNPIVKGVFDGWQLSGISRIISGTWSSIGYSFTGAPINDMTGGPGGSRVVFTCDPNLPRSERTYDRQFRTECVTHPGPKTLAGDIYYLGNAHGDEYLGMGYINHDLTIFKNFVMKNRRSIQFRLEMYNFTNQTQYGTVNTTAQFNFATGAQTNANFGKVTQAREASSRVIQLGLRFTW